jgi:hypothetical protein
VLHDENVGVQVGDDLLPILGQGQVGDDVFDERVDAVPVEFRVALPEVVRAMVGELLVDPGL